MTDRELGKQLKALRKDAARVTVHLRAGGTKTGEIVSEGSWYAENPSLWLVDGDYEWLIPYRTILEVEPL